MSAAAILLWWGYHLRSSEYLDDLKKEEEINEE